jgi:hypothetical protein
MTLLIHETPLSSRPHEHWAHFRFSVIGSLLAPPTHLGQLQTVLLGILMLPVIGADFCHH